MPLYLISFEGTGVEKSMADLDAALKSNALKSREVSAHQVLVQYGGGGAKNLHKRIVEMCGPIPKLSIFKIAPDYAFSDNIDAVSWLDDAVKKSAF